MYTCPSIHHLSVIWIYAKRSWSWRPRPSVTCPPSAGPGTRRAPGIVRCESKGLRIQGQCCEAGLGPVREPENRALGQMAGRTAGGQRTGVPALARRPASLRPLARTLVSSQTPQKRGLPAFRASLHPVKLTLKINEPRMPRAPSSTSSGSLEPLSDFLC